MSRSEFDDSYLEDEHRIRGAILTEPISNIPPREPVALPPGAMLRDAVRAMNQNRTGCVCVVEEGRLIGIFTERDLLRLSLRDVDPAATPLGKVMTASPETLRPEDGIALALNRMTVGGFRHIPLIDSDGRPVGIVAMRDIVRFIVSLFPDAVLNVPPDPTAIQTRYGG
jgi:CBS domain-containing protein